MDNTIKAVAFDVDGTLINSLLWEDLHALFGYTPQDDERLFFEYIKGNLTFRGFMEGMTAVYVRKNPKPVKAEIDAIFRNFAFAPHAPEVVRALSEKYPLALISSGFSEYVAYVAEALNIRYTYSYTSIEYDKHDAFARIVCAPEESEVIAKVDAVKDFGVKVGVTPSEIAYVGDSVNDLGAFESTGRGILIGEGTAVLHQASWKRINALPELLDIL